MPVPAQTSRPWLRRQFPWLLGVLAAAAVLVLPWWRNHTLLRDFYDYGLVIAASLRMELGEHPYVDFVTPIQTLHFLQARWAEMAFGPRYLSLTYPNAGLIVLAMIGLAALLRRPLGAVTALLVAMAVVASSSGQHTIVWHNAMGVTWTAAVIWLAAQPRAAAGSGAWLRLGLIWTLLWLGGMTKLTYQVTALAFVGWFALRDGWLGHRSWSRVALVLASYLGFGVVAPLVTELRFTGATLAQWWQNVIVTPGGRVELLQAIATVRFYLHTPHDYYPPLYFPFAGAWGVALLLALTVLAGRRLRATAAPRAGWVLLGGLVAGGWICASVLQATNFDIVYLAGAMWLVLGTGLALAALSDPEGRVSRAGRVVLGVAGLTLLVPAWQAAWHGTRALWDYAPGDRAALVSTNDLPARYAYFRDMRITPPLHQSMQEFAVIQDRLAQRGVGTEDFYFVNATEWMMRAMPGARLPGLPLWLHEGTTYREATARVIQRELASGRRIRAVVSLEGWNTWRHGMEWYLNTRYVHDRVGPLFHLYLMGGDLRERWPDPVSLSARTGSTAFAPDLVEAGGPFTLCRAATGPGYLGTPRSGSLRVAAALDRLEGELVVRRAPAGGGSPLDMVWRVTALGPGAEKTVLREERLVLAPEERERLVPFAADPGGRPVLLELFLPPDERVEAGFRRLHTRYHAAKPDPALPELLGEPVDPQPKPETWSEALFARGPLRATPREGAGLMIMADKNETGLQLFAHTPSIVWFRIDGTLHRLSGQFGLRPVTWTHPDALNGVAARVLFYRPGCLQLLFERELRPRAREQDRGPQTFDVALPGEDGWIALVYTALDSPRNTYGHSWWSQVDAR